MCHLEGTGRVPPAAVCGGAATLPAQMRQLAWAGLCVDLAKCALARRLCAMALRKARDGDGSSVCRGYVASRKATRKPVQARNDLRRQPLAPAPGTAASDEI